MRISITVHPDNYDPLLDFVRSLPELNGITVLVGRDSIGRGLANYTPNDYNGLFITIGTSESVQRFDNSFFGQITKIFNNPLFQNVSNTFLKNLIFNI